MVINKNNGDLGYEVLEKQEWGRKKKEEEENYFGTIKKEFPNHHLHPPFYKTYLLSIFFF